jgi:hypothetical protein
MSTRPGTLTADDLTTTEQANTAEHGLDALIHDCTLLPAGWGPDAVGHPTGRFTPPVPLHELVTRIHALGDVGDLDR